MINKFHEGGEFNTPIHNIIGDIWIEEHGEDHTSLISNSLISVGNNEKKYTFR